MEDIAGRSSGDVGYEECEARLATEVVENE